MGHRIELGEIETAASAIEDISACCCLYDTEKSQITLFVDAKLDKKTLNKALENILPKYMLPGNVVALNKLPMNPNGKIDRVKLKEMM